MSGLAVALDGRRLQDDPPSGVGRALAGLVPELASRCDLVVLADGRRAMPPSPAEVITLSLPSRLPEIVWLHGPARRWSRSHPDRLFHGSFNQLPVGLRGPAVVTINDLSFEVHPEDFTRLKRQAFRVQARSAARRARRVIAPSQFSAEEIIDHYGVDPDAVDVIAIAADPVFHPRAPHVGTPYIVAVGGARRRGLEVAVDAWRQVRSSGLDVQLHVLGMLPDRLRAPGIHSIGPADDATWAQVLAGRGGVRLSNPVRGVRTPGARSGRERHTRGVRRRGLAPRGARTGGRLV